MARLRHELLSVPGRVISHAGAPILRLPPGQELLPHGPTAQDTIRTRYPRIWV